VGERVALVGKVAYETDVLFYLFSLAFHTPDVVLASFVLKTTHNILVLFDYFQQFPFSVGFVEGFLLALAEVVVHSGVRCLAT
jgi:hypothetical protein